MNRWSVWGIVLVVVVAALGLLYDVLPGAWFSLALALLIVFGLALLVSIGTAVMLWIYGRRSE